MKTLQQALIDEILRSKHNPYSVQELEFLNEYHLQSLLQSVILNGEKHIKLDVSEIGHIRNKIGGIF
jgi:hypothetical protein